MTDQMPHSVQGTVLKQQFSDSNPDSCLFVFPDDPSSEYSGKSGSPSPAVLHRDFRESSVCSRSSADGPDDGGAVVAAAAAAVVDGRDERFPSPFNKQGSMVSLVVSRLSPVVPRRCS